MKVTVERSVDVPPIEPCVVMVVFIADLSLVEGFVMGVLELDVGEAVVRGDKAVTDDLDLGLGGDGLEIRVQDGPFGVY